ncbi:MAG TPA: hypothetical protein VFF69_04290 [Phycisphaerales bacterium]|nr:hypothetical protein [Phycisphaerales bacterium]
MHEKPKVLLVGHCGPDAYALRSAMQRLAPEAEFLFVNDEAALAAHPDAAALLVNRVLDGAFRAGSGVELIRRLPAEVRPRAAMISNFEDAQAEAEAAGAVRGFGKRELYSDRARACILTLLGRDAEV